MTDYQMEEIFARAESINRKPVVINHDVLTAREPINNSSLFRTMSEEEAHAKYMASAKVGADIAMSCATIIEEATVVTSNVAAVGKLSTKGFLDGFKAGWISKRAELSDKRVR